MRLGIKISKGLVRVLQNVDFLYLYREEIPARALFRQPLQRVSDPHLPMPRGKGFFSYNLIDLQFTGQHYKAN
jgi:hypothetical protein